MKVLLAQSGPTVCHPMDCSPPGSSVHGILQARILEWVTMPFSRGSSWPRDRTRGSCLAGRFFTIWATRETKWIRLWILCYHSMGKESACNSGDIWDAGSIAWLGRSPGEEIATHSNILAWNSPWTEEPDRLQSTGLWRDGLNWMLTHTPQEQINTV